MHQSARRAWPQTAATATEQAPAIDTALSTGATETAQLHHACPVRATTSIRSCEHQVQILANQGIFSADSLWWPRQALPICL